METTPSGGAVAAGMAVGGCGGGYPDSIDSSPHSRGGESWDDPFPSSAATNNASSTNSTSKLRFMCSYGGHIVPRPHDKSLCYLGGDTRIVVVDRHSTLADLSARLSRKLLGGRPFSLKYQLPSEDLDSLISVTTDEDLDNMIEEYDRIGNSNNGNNKSSRLRLFLFPVKIESSSPSSIGSLLDDSKSETWFVDALNGAIDMGCVIPRGYSGDSAASSVNCLLGLEEDLNNPAINSTVPAIASSLVEQIGEQQRSQLPRPDSSGKLKHGQEVHSVPDSPMRDTTSSFGSTSSAPSLSNLPPIRVRPEDRSPDKRGFNNGGLEEHFSLISVSVQKQDEGFKDGVFVGGHHQHTAVAPISVNPVSTSTSVVPSISPTENTNYGGRALSDDEKSDFAGMKKPPQPTFLQHQKPSRAFDVPISDRPVYFPERTSPVAVGWNTLSDPKHEGQSSVSDPNYRVHVQVSEQGYVLPLQQDQVQQHHHQQQPQQQQQFIHATPHLVQHHPSSPSPHLLPPHPSAPLIPIQSYYQMHQPIQPQQQLVQAHPYNSQMPVYFVSVPQNPAYTMAMQPNLADGTTSSGNQTVPVPNQMLPRRGVGLPQKPELAAPVPGSIYRTNATTTAVVAQPSSNPKIIHMTDQTHQYIPGYQPMLHHHPSQSPAAPPYGYEFSNQVHAQPVYYTQTVSNPLPSHFQTISSTPATVSDGEPQLNEQQPDSKQSRPS